MKKILKITFSLLFPLLLKANNPILISTNSFGIDQTKKLIVITKNVEEINLTYNHIKTEIIIDSQYNFENPVEMIEKGKPYTVLLADSQESYNLYFTDLPLVKIETPHEIVDSFSCTRRSLCIFTKSRID